MQLRRICAVKVVNIAHRTHMSLPNIVFVLLCGKGRYHCAMSFCILQLLYCVVKVVDIARRHTNAWAANLAIEWLPYSNVWETKFGHKSELKVKFKNPPDQSSSFCTFCMPI